MKTLFSKRVDVGRGEVHYFGSARAGAQALYFLRVLDREIALLAGLGAGEQRAFKRGRELRFEYRCHPDGDLSPMEAALLERFIGRLLRTEEKIVRQLQSGDGPALPEVSSAASADGCETFKLLAGPDAAPVTLRVSSREAGSAGLFHWSLDGPPELSPEVTGRLQQFFLAVVGHHLAGLPLPWVASGEEGKEKHPVFAYFDPKRPSFNEQTLSRIEVPEGANLVISFEVPSQCENQCIFCAPSESLEAEERVLTDEQVLAEAEAVFSAMAPHIARATRVDAVFVGRDAFNAESFIPLVERLHQEPKLTKVTVVSPGTRLRDADYVGRLKRAGLDVIMLTLLGPDSALHDAIAGRVGAYEDLLRSVDNLRAAGISWEFNTVVVRENLSRLPETLARAGELGSRVRVYTYVSEPFVPMEQAARCAPRFTDFIRTWEASRGLVENHVEAVHYVPYCLLPAWSRSLSGHSSQSFPAPPDELPEACSKCAEYGAHCGSVSAHYLALYGAEELVPFTA